VDELLSFVDLLHFDDILVADESDDLDLFSQEVFFSLSKWSLVYLLHRDDVRCVFVLALVNSWEFTIAKLASLDVCLFEAEIVGLLPHMSDPVLNDFLVHMK
jgi:hypothetical protein